MFISLNEKTHGYDHFTFAVHSLSPHRRVLSWLDESVSPTCWEPQTVFTQDPTMDMYNSCKKSDATVSLSNHRQTLRQTFKISACLLLFSSKISTNKTRFVTTATNVEPWIWKLVRIFFQILHYRISKRRWSQLGANILTSTQDFFVFKQPIKKFKLIQKSYVPRALRFSCQGSAGKGYGDENAHDYEFVVV